MTCLATINCTTLTTGGCILADYQHPIRERFDDQPCAAFSGTSFHSTNRWACKLRLSLYDSFLSLLWTCCFLSACLQRTITECRQPDSWDVFVKRLPLLGAKHASTSKRVAKIVKWCSGNEHSYMGLSTRQRTHDFMHTLVALPTIWSQMLSFPSSFTNMFLDLWKGLKCNPGWNACRAWTRLWLPQSCEMCLRHWSMCTSREASTAMSRWVGQRATIDEGGGVWNSSRRLLFADTQQPLSLMSWAVGILMRSLMVHWLICCRRACFLRHCAFSWAAIVKT